MVDEFLAMECDIANSIDRVLQDSLVFVELADTLQNAADYLVLLKLLVGLIVVFREIADEMESFLDEEFLLFIQCFEAKRSDAALEQVIAVLWGYSC